ncbi:hypothetical protein NC651_038776 [Populus alba x Populus x berolinensis]|nr:hypothetical protein NC651_038776 [Populus alba x Populus x berolinensis]
MHIVSSCPPPSPSISKNLASSILKNLYVPKKSNENKKEEAATRFFYELPNEESVLYAFKSDKSVSIDVL